MAASTSHIDVALQWSARLLVTVVWASATIFGLYILAFYFVALLTGETEQWNTTLPGLFDRETPAATLGIGLHFAAGGIILVLGCIQLITSIRQRYPKLHRWLGRLYVLAALATAVGGLVFILRKGTIGGAVMDIAFAGYGILMLLAALATVRYARAGNFEQHRAWGIRLFALAIGSWLYRMDYGFWFLITDGIGHTNDFRGGFDYFMDFFFYLPNLLVAEIFIGKYQVTRSNLAKVVAILGLVSASAFLLLATYFFTKKFWGEPIVALFG